MAEPELIQMPERKQPIPDMVDIDMAAGLPPHTARETTMLRAMTGRGFSELAGEGADDGDRERVIVWFKLRRLGYEPTWEEAADVLINYVTPDPPGPASSTPSSASVTSGS